MTIADLTRKRYLNRRELAEYLDSTVAGVANKTAKRQLPHIKLGRRVLYDRLAIDSFLRRHSVPAADDSVECVGEE